MRFFNTDSELKVYAVTGTNTVLLAMEIAKTKTIGKGFMGFRISRQTGNGNPMLLNGSKRFPKDNPENPVQKLSPIQSFQWKDYTADPDKTYTYTFEAMFGTWQDMQPKFSAKLTVRTEKLQDGEHSVYFNYGVTGSQAYAKQFDKQKIETLPEPEKSKAFAILGRELYKDGLVQFVAQAKNNRYTLLAAFYELDYAPFLEELKAARKRGATLKIVYSGRPDQVEANEREINHAGLMDVSIKRTFQVSQPHNKFMVLLEDGKPVQVWTGSTNITVRGIFGHSNTGHRVVNDALAKQYERYWKMLSTNPAKKDFAAEVEKIQKDVDGSKLTAGTRVIFSPRKTDAMLKEYVKMMDGAKDAVCVIYPFNIEKIFKDFYSEDRDYLRFIITDKGGDKTDLVTDDRDVFKTQGAVLKSAVENWVVEITSKATTGASTLYVHNKFFIVDPLGASPLVVSGSANFSDESLTQNDENTLIVKGNTRVADIYFTEFYRMFDHFLPRYLQNRAEEKAKGKKPPQAGFSNPLDDSGKWCDDYYNTGRLVFKRRQMFLKMKKAVKG